jgi:hypothetical protein
MSGAVRFVAFPATEYDEVLSGYQPDQMVGVELYLHSPIGLHGVVLS